MVFSGEPYSRVPGTLICKLGIFPAGVRHIEGVARVVHLLDVVVIGADGYRYRLRQVPAVRDDALDMLLVSSSFVIAGARSRPGGSPLGEG